MGIFKRKDVSEPYAPKQSAILADRISKLESECADIRAQLEQAEKAAIDAAGNDEGYAAAFQAITSATTECQAKGAILDKMRAALADALAREQAEFLNRLRGERASQVETIAAVNARIQKDRLAEEERHQAAIAALDVEFAANRNTTAEIDNCIALAESGIREESVREIAQLQAKKFGLSRRIPARLEHEYKDKKNQYERTASLNRIEPTTHPYSLVVEKRKQFEVVAAKWDDLAPIRNEIEEIIRKIAALKAKS